MECPTCGQPCSREIPENLSQEAMDVRQIFKDRGVKITPLQAKLLSILKNRNRPVSYGLLMETIYGWRPDGEYPLDKTLHVVASVARKKIKAAKLPWTLKAVWGYGYELEEKKTAKTMRNVALSLMGYLAVAHPLLAHLLG